MPNHEDCKNLRKMFSKLNRQGKVPIHSSYDINDWYDFSRLIAKETVKAIIPDKEKPCPNVCDDMMYEIAVWEGCSKRAKEWLSEN